MFPRGFVRSSRAVANCVLAFSYFFGSVAQQSHHGPPTAFATSVPRCPTDLAAFSGVIGSRCRDWPCEVRLCGGKRPAPDARAVSPRPAIQRTQGPPRDCVSAVTGRWTPRACIVEPRLVAPWATRCDCVFLLLRPARRGFEKTRCVCMDGDGRCH